MRYIISAHEFDPIVILGNTSHMDLRQAFVGQIGSAGHMKIVDGKVEVYGESLGFGMQSKPKDAEIIASKLGLPSA